MCPLKIGIYLAFGISRLGFDHHVHSSTPSGRPPARSTPRNQIRAQHRTLRDGLRFGVIWSDARHLRCDDRSERADVDEAAEGAGRLADGGVFDAPLLDP